MRLHLGLISSSEADLSAIRVTAISATGNTEPMTAKVSQPEYWSLKRFTGNIKAIEVLGVDPVSADKLQLVAGWEDYASPRIAVGPLTKTPIKDSDGNFQGVTLTRATSASLLSRFQHSLSWEGDAWFIAITFSQSLVITLALVFLFKLLGRAFLSRPLQSTSEAELKVGTWPRYLTLVLTYGFIAVLLVQINDRLSQGIFEFRDPIQQIALCVVQATLILSCLACLHFCRDYRSAIYIWATALFFLFSLKAVWLSQVTTIQCNDYGIYWSYGQFMATGDWDKINSESPLSLVLIRRSWAWCYWIAKVLGSTDTSLKLANFLLQLATAALFSWYVKARFGTLAMAAALIAFVIYPESWVSSTLASHDLPALFWFIVLLIAVDLLQQRLASPLITNRSRLSLFLRCCAVGAAIAVLDFQRDFGTLPYLL